MIQVSLWHKFAFKPFLSFHLFPTMPLDVRVQIAQVPPSCVIIGLPKLRDHKMLRIVECAPARGRHSPHRSPNDEYRQQDSLREAFATPQLMTNELSRIVNFTDNVTAGTALGSYISLLRPGCFVVPGPKSVARSCGLPLWSPGSQSRSPRGLHMVSRMVSWSPLVVSGILNP